MLFNKHSEFADHAFLSASKYHWVNYDEDKIVSVYNNWYAKQKGTELHEFAKRCIQLGQKLPRAQKTLNMFVNDAIGFRMTPEQPLFYTLNAYGTADAISFRQNLLRIHDLKTGVTKASMTQLEVYAAFFCLEYDINPNNIDIELRMYKDNDIIVLEPETIAELMDITIIQDKRVEALRLIDA
jgi:hypothetical protein